MPASHSFRGDRRTAAPGQVLLLLALVLAALTVADPVLARSSIGIGTSDPVVAPGNGVFSALFVEIAARQREFFSALREALIGLKRGEGALAFLAGLSFAYGIFHAAGPGHGKAVISSYMLASRAELRRGIALAFASSLVQGVSAILVVGAGWYLLRGTGISMTDATDWLEIASYALVTVFGLYLLARAMRKIGARWQIGDRIARLRAGLAPRRSKSIGGALAFAAAMAMMIAYTCGGARILHMVVTRGIVGRTQAWRSQ